MFKKILRKILVVAIGFVAWNAQLSTSFATVSELVGELTPTQIKALPRCASIANMVEYEREPKVVEQGDFLRITWRNEPDSVTKREVYFFNMQTGEQIRYFGSAYIPLANHGSVDLHIANLNGDKTIYQSTVVFYRRGNASCKTQNIQIQVKGKRINAPMNKVFANPGYCSDSENSNSIEHRIAEEGYDFVENGLSYYHVRHHIQATYEDDPNTLENEGVLPPAFVREGACNVLTIGTSANEYIWSEYNQRDEIMGKGGDDVIVFARSTLSYMFSEATNIARGGLGADLIIASNEKRECMQYDGVDYYLKDANDIFFGSNPADDSSPQTQNCAAALANNP